jgi:hypothetical protein
MSVETVGTLEGNDPGMRHVVEAAIAEPIERIRVGLAKEGAGLRVRIDEADKSVHVTLAPERIVCTGCLLPENLVRTLLTKALSADPQASPLRFVVETHDWPV